jgi:hypothetical protein
VQIIAVILATERAVLTGTLFVATAPAETFQH